MLNDLTPIVREVKVGSDKHLYGIADLHYGARNFIQKEWDLFIEKVKKDDDALVVIAGDLMNNAIKSSKSSVYDDVCSPSEQKQWLTEQLSPIADKIVCGVPGNHEYRSVREVDLNPLYDVFCKLGIEDRFRENGCFCVIRFITDENGERLKRSNKVVNPSYSLFVTHGKGSKNKLLNFATTIEGVDLIVSGHIHESDSLPKAKLLFDTHNNTVVTKPYNVLVLPSWLEYGDYALRDLYSPTAIPEVVATLSAHGKRITISQSI